MRTILEWAWRAAVVVLLAWIGVELHLLRGDVQPAPEDQTTASADSDPLSPDIDALRDEVATLTEKVDAMLLVISRWR